MGYNRSMAGWSRREFLKGLGALALSALPACRRAQEYAIEPAGSPDWMQTGDAVCYATSMPWPGGAVPLLAVCHGGRPVSLQPNPLARWRRGLPALVQATIRDLYDGARCTEPLFDGRSYPWQGLAGVVRAWSTALRAGRNVGFLFPEGYSAVRQQQVTALRAWNGARFYAYDPLAEPWGTVFPALERQQRAALGEPVRFEQGWGSLADLTEDLSGGLAAVFILTPADPAALDASFARALEETEAETFRLALRGDETSSLCRYVIPATHYLEEWGMDAGADGDFCLRQPVTMPLCPAVSEAELLDALITGLALLPLESGISPARRWLEQVLPGWRDGLLTGVVPGAPRPEALPRVGGGRYLHPLFVDGRFLHNAWLAEAHDVLSGAAGAPAVFLPGREAPPAVRMGGRVLPAACVPGLSQPLLPLLPGVEKNEKPVPVASSPFSCVPARHGSSAWKTEMHPGWEGSSPQWGMVIDVSRCMGCHACTVACRAENNIPPVGVEQLRLGRDLAWLRLERYLDEQGALAFVVPMACRHCAHAPCEAVCPVHATVHTEQGLNAMVYPRCLGVRYCAAACPYQARTFNFLDYAAKAQRKLPLPPNPEVTVRSRGVMEKCTYCAQRLPISRNGEAWPQTACQQACPVEAIRLVDLTKVGRIPGVIRALDVPGTEPHTLYVRSCHSPKN